MDRVLDERLAYQMDSDICFPAKTTLVLLLRHEFLILGVFVTSSFL